VTPARGKFRNPDYESLVWLKLFENGCTVGITEAVGFN